MKGSKLITDVGFLPGEGSSTVSPLTPGDLLIALHNIDSNKCDMKSIIKGHFLQRTFYPLIYTSLFYRFIMYDILF